MKVLIFAGHSANGYRGCGAVGALNESNENRRLGKKVVEYLKAMGIDAEFKCLDKPKTSNYLKEQVALANQEKYDVQVQIHFNASNGKGRGTETYYISSKGRTFAERVHNKLKTIFRDRGVKSSTGLYWLKNTNSPSILIEVCFCDNNDDAKLYNNNFNKIAQLIAEGIANKTYTEPKEEPIKDESSFIVRITTEELNIRKEASFSSEVVGVVKKGEAYTIVEVKNGLGRMKSGKGWISLNEKYVKRV